MVGVQARVAGPPDASARAALSPRDGHRTYFGDDDGAIALVADAGVSEAVIAVTCGCIGLTWLVGLLDRLGVWGRVMKRLPRRFADYGWPGWREWPGAAEAEPGGVEKGGAIGEKGGDINSEVKVRNHPCSGLARCQVTAAREAVIRLRC